MLSFELLSINLYIDLLNYLHLGCSLEVEKFAVDYDIDAIAFPEDETYEYAKGKREIFLSYACCGNVVFDIFKVITS